MQEKTCLYGLVEVLASIHFNEMPKDVSYKAKECLADFIGIFMNSAQKNDAITLKEALRDTVLTNAEDMALWMGSTARMLDIDDGHRFAMAHPGVVVIATAIAIAVKQGNVDGQKLIEAITRGYEVYCYQGRAINPSAYLKRGIDATCVCGAAAAAVVSGTMMNFNKTQFADAIALAASLAGGLNQSAIDGSAQKYIVAGWGAKLGIAAANMAKYGLGGPNRVFEGKLGFCNAFAPEPDWEHLTNPKLNWDIRSVYIKMYACVRRIHCTLDAVNDIVKTYKLGMDDIDCINVYGSQFLFDAGGYEPKDMAQAQTSVPYAVALLMKYGCVEDHLVHENIGHKEINEYSYKIKVIKAADMVAMAEKDKSLWGAARVELKTKSGQVYTAQQTVPYGDPESPLPAGAVEEKFIKLVEGEYGLSYARSLWSDLMKIEDCADTGNLFKAILAKT